MLRTRVLPRGPAFAFRRSEDHQVGHSPSPRATLPPSSSLSLSLLFSAVFSFFLLPPLRRPNLRLQLSVKFCMAEARFSSSQFERRHRATGGGERREPFLRVPARHLNVLAREGKTASDRLSSSRGWSESSLFATGTSKKTQGSAGGGGRSGNRRPASRGAEEAAVSQFSRGSSSCAKNVAERHDVLVARVLFRDIQDGPKKGAERQRFAFNWPMAILHGKIYIIGYEAR